MFLRKSILKICSKFTGEHSCRCAISIKLLFALRHGSSTVNLLHIFRTPFSKNTSKWLLLNLFIDLTNQYQIKRLIKLRKACAGLVLNKYSTCEDITKLKWLLELERINFTIAKLIFKGLLKENVSDNLEK